MGRSAAAPATDGTAAGSATPAAAGGTNPAPTARGGARGGRRGGLAGFSFAAFETVLVDELIPYIDANFRTLSRSTVTVAWPACRWEGRKPTASP